MKKVILFLAILAIIISCKKETTTTQQKTTVNSVSLYETASDGVRTRLGLTGNKPASPLYAPPVDQYTSTIAIDSLTVRVTNLQDTSTRFYIKIPSDTVYTLYQAMIQPDSSLIVPFRTCGEFRAKPTNETCGIVGLNTCFSVLATRLEYLEYNQSNARVHIVWKLSDVATNSKYFINLDTNNGIIEKEVTDVRSKRGQYTIDIEL